MFFKGQFLFPSVILLGILVILYFISRKSIQELYILILHIFHNSYIAMIILAILFYPGTLIHELSHFIMAILMRLKVHEISLMPQKVGHTLRLGYVLYERKDPVRGVLVGIAPILSGIGLLWWLHTIHFFGNDSVGIQIIKGYITFVLTSTMFSSRQDLVDLIYILPLLGLLAFGALYWNIDILNYIEAISHLEAVNNFLYAVTINSAISLCIHIVAILICFSIRRILSIHHFI